VEHGRRAERLGIIATARPSPAHRRPSAPRDDGAPRASGQFYNWYDHTTGAKLTKWPDPGHDPILSSVDNGWLAAP
jgi:hypothetical protein